MAKAAAFIAGHDAVRCQHRPFVKHGRCGIWVYVLVEPEGQWWTCEVNARDILHMQEQRMTALQCKAYLMLTSPTEHERRAA